MESDENNLIDPSDESVSEIGVPSVQIQSKKLNFKLEPALLLLMFGWNLSGTVTQNQIIKQTCLYTYGFNETICSQLGGRNESDDIKKIEEYLQPHVAKILMSMSLLQSIVPALMSLFIGPWSDKFGRKPVLNFTFFGFSISMSCVALVSYFSDYVQVLDPWYYAFAVIPLVAFGGFTSMLIAILCYSTDLTTESNRSIKIGIIEIIIFVGIFFGTLSSSFILRLTNPTIVFVISAVCAVLATIYTILFVDESVVLSEEIHGCTKVKELFSPVLMKEMVSTCFRRRPFNERKILWLLITILMLSIFTMNGSSMLGYLFVREKFDWTIVESSYYDSVTMILTISGSLFGLLVLKKILKMSDISLAVLALVSTIIDSLIKAFAFEPWHMYFASGISVFKILSSPMCRTLISTIVPNNEIGKVYSITSSIEALSGLGSAPLYTYIYSNTLKTFPGAYQLITAGVYVFNLGFAICVSVMKKTRDAIVVPYAPITS
ncbi:unnamed protein product [Diamesa serratosioi]